jgi:uncharacterized protein YjiS (DUF1127 family)
MTGFHNAPHASPAGSGVLARAVATLQRWRERGQERRQLLRMTPRELHDIGLSNVDAWREANKPLWRD